MSVSSWFAGIVKSDVLWLENGPSINCSQNIFSVSEIHVVLQSLKQMSTLAIVAISIKSMC